MRPVLAWFRLDARRRWSSLVVLTLLIALASGTAMAAVAGAKRGANAVERLQAQTLPATLLVQPATPGFDWAPVRALPEVEALAEVVFSAFEIDGRLAAESFMLPPADAEAMWSVERPVVIEGRLADPDRADEVVVTPAFMETFGKGVGDNVALGLYTPEQIDTAQGPDTASTNLTDLWILTGRQQAAGAAAGVDRNEATPAAGPVVPATIVGVIRSPMFGDRLDTPGFVVPSAGLYAQYTPNLLGAERLASVNALVRLDGGEAAIPEFLAGLSDVTGRADIDIFNLATLTRLKISEATGFEAISLLVVAIVASAAAIVLVGIAVARYAALAVTDLHMLRAVGLTPWQRRLAAAAGPTVAAIVGTALGAVAALIASRWFPIGTAAFVEPAPGMHVDAGVLAAGLIGVPVIVAAGAVVVAVRVVPSTGSARSGRRSAVATAAANAGLPVPVVIGARHSLEPGRGRQSVPVRPALVGAVAGITGVLGALTFSGAVEEAATNPARVGIVHQVEAWVGFDNVTFAPADVVFAALAAVPGVSGVNDVRVQAAEAGGERVNVFATDPVGGTAVENLVTEGRPPATPTEALLSNVAADTLDAGLGDTVVISGTTGETELVVVGIGVIDRELGPIAVTTPAAYSELFGEEFMMRYGEVGLEPGVEPQTILPDLYAAVPVSARDFGLFPKEFVSPAELRFMRPLPLVLAGFLAVLALVAVGYTLTSAVRRRRHDVAVLRALGLTPAQTRGVVFNQATVTALVGLAVGLPLGAALGRTVWRYVADALFLHYEPPAVWLVVALLVPMALLIAGLLAARPARHAASLRVADVLRAE